MGDRVVYVVGARFAAFTTGRLFLSVTQLRRLLVEGDDAHTVVLPGQGLGDKDVAAVLAMASSSPRRDRFDFTEWYHRPKRADLGPSGVKDVLISSPRRVAQTAFELDLLIDGACSLMTMADPRHPVLVEAARQSAVAIGTALDTDQKYQASRLDEDVAWCDRFVLALDARIRCTINLETLRLDIAIDQGEALLAVFIATLAPVSGAVALPAVA